MIFAHTERRLQSVGELVVALREDADRVGNLLVSGDRDAAEHAEQDQAEPEPDAELVAPVPDTAPRDDVLLLLRQGEVLGPAEGLLGAGEGLLEGFLR